MNREQKIFLIGLPGAGKTTMGLNLSSHLGLQFIDLDACIEKDTNQSVEEIFLEKGESHFRKLEKKSIEKITLTHPSFVMATGGGTPAFFNNFELMQREGTTIFIDTPLEEIAQRLKKDSSIRPLMKEQTLSELYEKRKKWYNQANHTIQKYNELLVLFSKSE